MTMMEAVAKTLFDRTEERASGLAGGLAESDLEFFREKIFERAGINISAHKKELVRSRLVKRLRVLKLSGFEEYRSFLEGLSSGHQEWTEFVNALTTNKTEWFREASHFETLKEKILPKFDREGERKLKIWCCASSTGEEAYSLAFVCSLFLKKRDFEIHASDIDTAVLKTAQSGVYRKDQALDQTPPEFQRFFDRGEGPIERWVRVNRKIKEKIVFRQKNLMEPPENAREFDIVFCRNVLIYFQPRTIEEIMGNLWKASKDNALLFIGHSESLQNLDTPYKYLKTSIYAKGSKLAKF